MRVRTDFLGALLLVAGVAVAAEPDRDAVLEQIRGTGVDPAGIVEVHGLEVDLGLGVLELEEGLLFPATTVAGRTYEMVFLGQAWFRITPPDELEAAQLELFTDQDALATAVDRAVLMIGNEAIVKRLLERDAVPEVDAAQLEKARATLAEWIDSPERKGIGTDAAIFKAAFGDIAHQGFFTAVCDSEDHGRFFYIYDPTELEQIALGQFVPLELDDRDRYRTERQIRRAKRRGRSIQTRLEDIGHWDTWISTSPSDGERAVPGSTVFESAKYVLDVSIDPSEQRIEGTARIEMTAQTDGAHAVTLELFDDLKTRKIRDGAGRDLAWLRSGQELNVILAEPAAAGDTVTLEVEYGGVGLVKLESGIFALADTYAWYPHVGTIDRAPYDVTLRVPKKLGLFASGRLVDESIEGNQRVERRELDIPAFAFTFEVGDFDVFREQVGHVDVTVAISKTSLPKASGAKQHTVETVKDALAYYEEQFGAYPLDHLTVATIPRPYSQGFLGMVTLSHFLLVDRGFGRSTQRRRETIAHELAHQWWGNQVGWYSYRDQWLSEALADFSAVLYVKSRSEQGVAYLNRHARGWQWAISRQTADGRPLESLGPVVMGQRLVSSKSRTAYQSIVYDKGSVVLSMLARNLGEEALVAMLRSLAEAVAHRAIDTETFLKSLERMSGLELAGFADQFIYGTGVPEVYYSYDFKDAGDGQWEVAGEALQVAPPRYRYAIQPTQAGTWQIAREREGTVDVEDWAVIVPFQIVLDEEPPAVEERKDRKDWSPYTTGRGLGGRMILRGESSAFSFTIKEKPRDLWLDQGGEVLATFYSENRQPKRMLRYRALRAEPPAQAELLEQALRAPVYSEQVAARLELTDKELERRTQYENAVLHLDLATMHLDAGRAEQARSALEAAEELFGRRNRNSYSVTRQSLACRLDVLAGEYQRAYDSLARTLRLPFPVRDDDRISDKLRRNKWRRGRRGSAETYSLLAISAHETGNPEVARRAAEEAQDRGADVSLLLARLH